MNKPGEARLVNDPPSGGRLPIARSVAAATGLASVDQLGAVARPLRALIASPKPLRDRQWLVITEGAEAPKWLSDRGLCDIISEQMAAAPSDDATGALNAVSVLFWSAEGSGSDAESAVPALIRRMHYVLETGERATSRQVIEAGVIRIDKDAHQATAFGRAVTLTTLEFRLLEILVERADRVQSREALLEVVWGLTNQIYMRTVDTHIKRLRDKLGIAGQAIETVRSVGYRLNRRAAVTLRENDSGIAEAERASRGD